MVVAEVSKCRAKRFVLSLAADSTHTSSSQCHAPHVMASIFARRALSAQAARAVSAQASGAKLGLEGLAGKVPRAASGVAGSGGGDRGV